MRLDKFVSQAKGVTRSQAKKAIKSGRISLDGMRVTNPAHSVAESASVSWLGELLQLFNKRYILLNKPCGYICSTLDEDYPSALNLIGMENKKDLHFAGRLDVDTTGLVLISDDGSWSHRVTSPRRACPKVYRVWTGSDCTSDDIKILETGVKLRSDAKPTLPARVIAVDPRQLLLTISEGRYHQIKRMFGAIGNRVVRLARESVGNIHLDGVKPGEWRHLQSNEIDTF